jgi:SagB-type dehydrogenase family enzyme
MVRSNFSSFQRPVLGEDFDVEDDLFSISEIYHENTKLHHFSLEEELDLSSPAAVAAMTNARTVFRDVPRIRIARFTCPDRGIFRTLRRRRSTRAFASSRVKLQQVAVLLEAANGITAHMRTPGGFTLYLRASPSAGALYPTEIFLAVQCVEDLTPGLYHYNPTDQELAILCLGNVSDELREICLGWPLADSAAFALLLTCNMKRIRHKYGERGYRYGLLDMGHLMQSLWLVATELDLGFVSLGGFNDDAARKLLPIDGVENILGYAALVGTKEETTPLDDHAARTTRQ